MIPYADTPTTLEDGSGWTAFIFTRHGAVRKALFFNQSIESVEFDFRPPYTYVEEIREDKAGVVKVSTQVYAPGYVVGLIEVLDVYEALGVEATMSWLRSELIRRVREGRAKIVEIDTIDFFEELTRAGLFNE